MFQFYIYVYKIGTYFFFLEQTKPLKSDKETLVIAYFARLTCPGPFLAFVFVNHKQNLKFPKVDMR